MNINWSSPAVFMCTEKHFCSLQWGHQLRRALSITQFPFPAKGQHKSKNIILLRYIKLPYKPEYKATPSFPVHDLEKNEKKNLHYDIQ